MADNPSNEIPDTSTERTDPSAIRQSFRVPVEIKDDISIMLENQIYRVVDISPEGVNISGTDPASFKVGQLIENCELILPGTKIQTLTARIVHSSSGSQNKGSIGIQWVKLDDEAQQQIASCVSMIKQRLLKAAQG